MHIAYTVTSNGSVLPDLGPISDLKSIICINKVRFKGKRSGLGTVFVLERVRVICLVFDEYCINCDLAFVARLCLKIHNKSTRIRIVIHVILHLRPVYVSKYTLGCLREMFRAPCNMYVICMIFNMPYMTISIDIQYIVRRGEKFDPNCSICDLIFVPGVRLKTRRLGLLKHLFLIAIQQIALIMI